MRAFLIGKMFLYRQEIETRNYVNRNPKTIAFRRHGNRPKGMNEIAREISDELNLVTGTIFKISSPNTAAKVAIIFDNTNE